MPQYNDIWNVIRCSEDGFTKFGHCLELTSISIDNTINLQTFSMVFLSGEHAGWYKSITFFAIKKVLKKISCRPYWLQRCLSERSSNFHANKILQLIRMLSLIPQWNQPSFDVPYKLKLHCTLERDNISDRYKTSTNVTCKNVPDLIFLSCQ